MAKKYYWLKLKEDFFENDDIKMLENIPNGKDYVIFYLKLLCKSLKNEGTLRYKGILPYTPEMLATITNTNIDIVNGALEKLKILNMVEILDDGALFMLGVEEMTGSETQWAEKKRIQRQSRDNVQPKLECVQEQSNNCPTEIEKEIELDKDIENRDRARTVDTSCQVADAPPSKNPKSSKRFIKPTLDEVRNYCKERNNNVNAEKWIDYYEANGWKVGKNSMKDWEASVRTWEQNDYNNNSTTNNNQVPNYDAGVQGVDYL